LRASGFGLRVSCFVFRVSCFVFRVSGFGFRVSGFGFRVSGFGNPPPRVCSGPGIKDTGELGTCKARFLPELEPFSLRKSSKPFKLFPLRSEAAGRMVRTFHPTPHTLHLTPYTPHPTPYTINPTPYTLHLTPYTLHLKPYTSHPSPYNLNITHLPHRDSFGFRVSGFGFRVSDFGFRVSGFRFRFFGFRVRNLPPRGSPRPRIEDRDLPFFFFFIALKPRVE